jgi:hypothetical protein
LLEEEGINFLQEADSMAMMSRARLALQLIAAALLLSAVLGSAARPLEGDEAWVVVGDDGPLQSSGGSVTSIVDALRRLYMQQLGGPGLSCGTNSPNNACPP